MTRSDLLTMVEAQAAQYEQQPGEYTREELLAKCGGQEWKLKVILDKLRAEGKLKKRRIAGSKIAYRLEV